MIWLTGARTPHMDKVAALNGSLMPLGLLVTPFTASFLSLMHNYEWIGIDNGCFSQPEKFDLEVYLELIREICKMRGGEHSADDVLFATAPDVVGDWYGTLVKSLPILPKIREAGALAAICVQEGIEKVPLDKIPWDAFDVLFVGGNKENDDWFKLGSAMRPIIKEAHRRRKWVHIGRINGATRCLKAVDMGADSADGTYIRFKYGEPLKGTPDVAEWLREVYRKQVKFSREGCFKHTV